MHFQGAVLIFCNQDKLLKNTLMQLTSVLMGYVATWFLIDNKKSTILIPVKSIRILSDCMLIVTMKFQFVFIRT